MCSGQSLLSSATPQALLSWQPCRPLPHPLLVSPSHDRRSLVQIGCLSGQKSGTSFLVVLGCFARRVGAQSHYFGLLRRLSACLAVSLVFRKRESDYRKIEIYGVIGMLDFMRDPSAEGVAPPKPFLGEDDAPFCSPLGDLAELASRSFRNCSLFMVTCQAHSKAFESRGRQSCTDPRRR